MIFHKKLLTWLLISKVKKIDKLHLKHQGEECYLFGDGASLKWMDLPQFSNRTSITGSFLVYHKDFKTLKVPYNTITEPIWFFPIFPYRGYKKLKIFRHRMHEEYRKTIREYPQTLFFINVSNFFVTCFKNSLFVSRWYKPKFEKNNPFLERTDCHDGTLKFQISLAIFLGFKKAYLVGHDYTHSPSRSYHYYEKGEGEITEDKHFIPDFIEYAKKHIELVTVTLDGKGEFMDSITYKNLTGKEPAYHENTELVDMIKLKNLATWHGYRIF